MSDLRDFATRPDDGYAASNGSADAEPGLPVHGRRHSPASVNGKHHPAAAAPSEDIGALFAERERDRYAMHSSHLNEQMVRVLRTIGYDVGFCRGSGQYLFDRDNVRYLDLLSGFGTFAIGRNHPTLRKTLTNVLAKELPNLVQLDVSTLAGILAERLLAHAPYLDKAFFANSGAEAVEAR